MPGRAAPRALDEGKVPRSPPAPVLLGAEGKPSQSGAPPARWCLGDGTGRYLGRSRLLGNGVFGIHTMACPLYTD